MRLCGPCSPTTRGERCSSAPRLGTMRFTTYMSVRKQAETGLVFIIGRRTAATSPARNWPRSDARPTRACFVRSMRPRSRRCKAASIMPFAGKRTSGISRSFPVIAQRAGDQCHIIDEIVLADSNTQDMMEEINRRYCRGNGVVHPDPSGAARKTSAPVGQNDFVLIRQAGWRVNAPEFGPVVDRITNVNARLCDANGQRRVFIDPKCRHLIRALDTLTYKKETKIPDKSTGQDHITDALGYLMVAAFPIVRSGLRVGESPFW
jgi:hypothetical protein